MQKIQVRGGTINEVVEINNQITSWQIRFTKEHFENFLNQKDYLIVTAILDKNPVGFFIVWISPQNKTLNYWVVGVVPGQQNKGLFRAMHSYAINWAKKKGLTKIFADVARKRYNTIYILLKYGYKIIGSENCDNLEDSRIFFEKVLS